jgi:membrane-anchored protein YejM (alkaline phosphatase superfamily)
MRERAEANQRAEQVARATNSLVTKMNELTIAVTTAELQMQAMREAKEESVREQLRRLAQQQQEEEEAEKTRVAIEARQAELKNRQREAEFSVQPEPEKPKEQKPKVVHIKARPAVAGQKVTQYERG